MSREENSLSPVMCDPACACVCARAQVEGHADCPAGAGRRAAHIAALLSPSTRGFARGCVRAHAQHAHTASSRCTHLFAFTASRFIHHPVPRGGSRLQRACPPAPPNSFLSNQEDEASRPFLPLCPLKPQGNSISSHGDVCAASEKCSVWRKISGPWILFTSRISFARQQSLSLSALSSSPSPPLSSSFLLSRAFSPSHTNPAKTKPTPVFVH